MCLAITTKEYAAAHRRLARAGVPESLRRLDAEIVERLSLKNRLIRWWIGYKPNLTE